MSSAYEQILLSAHYTAIGAKNLNDTCVFAVASKWCDPEPGDVPGPLREAPGTPTAARPAVQKAPAPVRTLRGDDL